MKTTIEIPDPLFRRAKFRAAERGQTLKQLVTEALREKLASDSGRGSSPGPPWMRGFGELSRLTMSAVTGDRGPYCVWPSSRISVPIPARSVQTDGV